ncbi:MAG: pyridoxamine kinase [Bacteroidales bacterium]|nr:pyridoxamine kinase [Bacteroidales bacterium]
MSRKIAIINDISGYGRCSTSVILPIVSHLGVQGCALPTAIFSNHTGFPSFYCMDFTQHMPAYIREWKKLELQFDGIMTGFLGSARQIGIVEDFIAQFRNQGTQVLVDPVMGDNGRIYATYTEKLCREMRRLIAYADIITPNLTEACFLTGTRYHESGWKRRELDDLAHRLLDMGARKLVITGIHMGSGSIGNAIAEAGGEETIFQRQLQVEQTRSGTGDVFAAILAADAVNGVDFVDSCHRSSRFVRQCLVETIKSETAHNTGIDFESQLERLKRK